VFENKLDENENIVKIEARLVAQDMTKKKA